MPKRHERINPRATAPLSAGVGGDDEQLVQRMVGGELAAFETLYDRYCPRALMIATLICHDEGQAEDSVQEAFLSVWRNPASYNPLCGGVGTWLLCIVRYRAIDSARGYAKRAARRADEAQLDGCGSELDVSEQVIALDDAARMRQQLRRLPDVQQEVIALAYYGQLTHVEIASHLRLSEGTVKGRMRLGLRALRSQAELLAA